MDAGASEHCALELAGIRLSMTSAPFGSFVEEGAAVTKKVTIPYLRLKKQDGRPITMLTAYDYPSAQLVDEAGVDIILVGDSLAMTMLGHPDTVSVTMDEMLHHCRAVARGARRSFLVGDMPFMSYQVSREESIRNAARFLKEAGMDAVKLEAIGDHVATVRAIVRAGISVMGHIGLTPQIATQLGGFRVQGKTVDAARELVDDALRLQDAGCFALVLEAIPAPVAEQITQQLSIPTIGIGAGSHCDGQVLVYHDILGLFAGFTPKFVKRYAELREPIVSAIRAYVEDVEAGAFPTDANTYSMEEEERQLFLYGRRDEEG